jgi:hypothetical protein
MCKHQNQKHDMHSYCIPRYRFHLQHAKTKQQEETLTVPEREAYEILSKTKHDSVWGEAIKRSLAPGSPAKFRKLIDQLYSNGLDSPVAMIKIIGEEAWGAVLNCKEGVKSAHSHD